MSVSAGLKRYRLVPLTAVPVTALLDFLSSREKSSVGCAYQLYMQHCLPLSGKWLCAAVQANAQLEVKPIIYHFEAVLAENQLCGILGISPAGLMLHCLDVPEIEESALEMRQVCAQFFLDKKLYCISGERRATLLLEAAAAESDRVPAETRNYFLMQMSSADTSRLKRGPYILRCRTEDGERLFPLEAAFEQEEVLPAGWCFNPATCRLKLTRALRTSFVCGVLGDDGECFAAKGAVSAEGAHWVQIGGVYTDPEYRGRGYAAAVVRYLSQKAVSVGKRPVLYVNEVNTAAVKAYVKAGFAAGDRYRICYF